jgi:hypothetical protein
MDTGFRAMMLLLSLVERRQHSPRIQRHCTAFRSMVSTRFGLSRKSGNFQTGMSGNFAPDSVATYFRNAWQLSSEIRSRPSQAPNGGESIVAKL